MEMTITSLEKASYNAPPISHFIEALHNSKLQYYAQDWIKTLGYSNMDELHEVIFPLIDAMKATNIDSSENLKLVYRCNEGKVFEDWKLSRLGLIYIAFNSPHKNQKIREFQLNLLANYLNETELP